MAYIKDIRIFHKFSPKLNLWFSRSPLTTHYSILRNEVYDNGDVFSCGVFIFIQLKYFALHFKFKWWVDKLHK